eukprot:2972216-Rhodomonas_salina.2
MRGMLESKGKRKRCSWVRRPANTLTRGPRCFGCCVPAASSRWIMMMLRLKFLVVTLRGFAPRGAAGDRPHYSLRPMRAILGADS